MSSATSVGVKPSEIGVATVRKIACPRSESAPLSPTAMHRWWYRVLERAGVVAKGETRGWKMHAAR